MKITSQPLTFLDTTDSRKLEVYISSNHPTIQLYDMNDKTYTPDWSETNLKLSADIFLDSSEIIPEKMMWYRQYVNEITETLVSSGEYTQEITIDSNMVQAVATYICRVEYQGLTAFAKITFTRTNTGKNGADGKDGTSIRILGTATAVTPVDETDYYTITYSSSAVTAAEPGDAYLFNGNLYVCAVIRDTDDYFINVGNIQGPAGTNGVDAKLIKLSSSSQVFKINSARTVTPATITVTATAINTSVSAWTYSTDGGKKFSEITPTGLSRNGNTITITGSTLIADTVVIKASDGTYEDTLTVHKVADGANGAKGDAASIAFLTNENISFAANAGGQVSVTSLTTNIVAYKGTEKIMPTVGSLTGVPDGMTITVDSTSLASSSKEVMLTVSVANNSTLGSASSNHGAITIPVTSPVSTNLVLSWSKINTGATGASGTDGADAYTVLLTNESHTFAGEISSAVDGGIAETQIIAYKGATKQSVTISTVNGKAAGIVDMETGIPGLKFKCDAISGSDIKITFTCTNEFNSHSGTIPIVLTIGDVTFTKMFTYSIAFKGDTGITGATGATGSPATAYWLVSDASVVQKSASGTVVLTPSTLTFTGKSKTGTSAPTDYGCRWIIAYSTDGSTYTNAYTSAANETTKTFTVDSTYKTIRARMYMAGGTTTLLDEQIIPVVADGAIGTPGTNAVTFQIYSSNGYALSTSTPNVTLQTFAYVGDVAITAGAAYQWYVYNSSGWTALSGETNAYLNVSREDVEFSKSYMCKMTFNNVEYTSVATIDDKNDDNKVFTVKPSNYASGDLWIVGVDYIPAGFEIGTLLRAEHTNSSYADSDWVTATKYDNKINDIQTNIDTYNQYFSFDSTNGVTISARDANGQTSNFSTSLTNTRLAFNYGNQAVAYIDGTKMNIKEAEIESPLTVTGKYSGSTMLQAPVINIGNFSIIVESNGSLSIVANT